MIVALCASPKRLIAEWGCDESMGIKINTYFVLEYGTGTVFTHDLPSPPSP